MKEIYSVILKIVLTIVVVATLVLSSSAAPVHPKEATADLHIPTAELREKARAELRSGDYDQALKHFTIIANRYDPSMSYEDKHICGAAYNNIGYTYFFHNCNFYLAFQNLLKAMEIAEEINDHKLLPFIYQNLGNVYASFYDYPETKEYLKKSFDCALEEGYSDIAITALSNMVVQGFIHDDVISLIHELERFEALELPQGTEMVEYMTHLIAGTRAYLQNNNEKALTEFQLAIENVNVDFTPERYVFDVKNVMASVHASSGDYRTAINIMRCLEREASDDQHDDVLSDSYQKLARYYKAAEMPDSFQYYDYKFLAFKDSITNANGYGTLRGIQNTYDLQLANEKMMEMNAERRSNMIVIFSVSGVALVVALLSFGLYRNNRKLRDRNEDLFNRTASLFQAEKRERALRSEYQQKLKDLEKGAPAESEPATAVDSEEEKDPAEADNNASSEHTKYKRYSLDAARREEVIAKIDEVLNHTDAPFTYDFTIDQLAIMIGEKPKNVSMVINEVYNKNFSALLAEVRVKEACERIQDVDRFGNLTIEAISQSVGYKSRTNFVAVFKRITGLTPSEYQRIALNPERRMENV